MTRYWVDVADSAWAVQGDGPLANILGLSVSHVLDGAGEVKITVPVAEQRALTLVDNESRCILNVLHPYGYSQALLGETSDGTVFVGRGTGGAYWQIAQTITGDGYLTQMNFVLGANTGNPSAGTVTWEIRSYAATPGLGTVLLSGIFTPVQNATNSVVPLDPLWLEPGTLYYLVFRSTGTFALDNTGWNFVTSTTPAYGMLQWIYSVSWVSSAVKRLRMTLYNCGVNSRVTNLRELGRGVLRNLTTLDSAGSLRYELTGLDQLDELSRINVKVYTCNGTTNIAAINAVIAMATGWTIDTSGATGGSVAMYKEWIGASVLQVLQDIAKMYGYHFRLDADRHIHFGSFVADTNFVRLVQPGSRVPVEEARNSLLAFVDRLQLAQITEETCNWLLPFGQGDDLLTLRYSTKPGTKTVYKDSGAVGDIGFDWGSKLAQSFQSGSNVLCSGVRVSLENWYANLGTGAGDTLTLRLETDNAGKPSGTLIDAKATATMNVGELPLAYGWQMFHMDTFQINAATTYWAVLTSSNPQEYIRWQYATDTTYDAAYYNAPNWTIDTARMFYFEVYAVALGSTAPAILQAQTAAGYTYYYLQDATSIGLYGQIEKAAQLDIKPLGSSADDLLNAANQLYTSAVACLDRSKNKRTVYRAEVKHVLRAIKPGQSIKLAYKGYVVDAAGNTVQWADINSSFYVLKVVEQDGERTTLEISDQADAPDTLVDKLADVLSNTITASSSSGGAEVAANITLQQSPGATITGVNILNLVGIDAVDESGGRASLYPQRFGPSQCRLSLHASDPYADVENGTNLYLLPTALGDTVELYVGGHWKKYHIGSLSLSAAIPATAYTLYDAYLYPDASDIPTLDLVAWTAPPSAAITSITSPAPPTVIANTATTPATGQLVVIAGNANPAMNGTWRVGTVVAGVSFQMMDITNGSDPAAPGAGANGGTWTQRDAVGGTRVTAVTTQDGRPVKTGEADHLHLGTFKTMAAGYCSDFAGAIDGNPALRLLSNTFNRVERFMVGHRNNVLTAYGLVAGRPYNNDMRDRIEFVVGEVREQLATGGCSGVLPNVNSHRIGAALNVYNSNTGDLVDMNATTSFYLFSGGKAPVLGFNYVQLTQSAQGGVSGSLYYAYINGKVWA